MAGWEKYLTDNGWADKDINSLTSTPGIAGVNDAGWGMTGTDGVVAGTDFGLDIRQPSSGLFSGLGNMFDGKDGMFDSFSNMWSGADGKGGINGFLGSDSMKNLTGLGQLAMGFMEYGDKKAMNDQTLAGMRHNLAQSKKEAGLEDAYRASYGA